MKKKRRPFTVAGFYKDNSQRFTGWYKAFKADQAEAMAKREAEQKHQDELVVVAVFKGHHRAQESGTYI